MAEFLIPDQDLATLKDKVVLLTGCSSGIGYATVELLVSLGAKVVGGDVNENTSQNSESFTFVKTDVTSWADLTTLFKRALSLHGRIDHVFANAGVVGTTNYVAMEALDDNGDLLEPSHRTLDINFKAVVNTTALAIHHLRRQGSVTTTTASDTPAISTSASAPAIVLKHGASGIDGSVGGSIVITASASSYQRFRSVDYTAAKHAVLGLMRGLVVALEEQGLSEVIRINAIAPSWTSTGIVPHELIAKAGSTSQPPAAPARSAAILMADTTRNGQLIYSVDGRFKEVEQSVLLPAAATILPPGHMNEDEVALRIRQIVKERTSKEKLPP